VWGSWWLLTITVVGCNWAFDLTPTELTPTLDAAPRPDADPRVDNDRDGIKDVVDPCIAADTDLLVDSDGDGTINNGDACPFVMASTNDADGDGIGDACDPFATAGDRVRCLIAFTDPELDTLVWRARGNAPSWTLHHARVIVGDATQAIITDWPYEGPRTTTYEIVGRLFTTAAGTFQVLVRAGDTPSPTDLGCAIDVRANAWTVRVVPTGELNVITVSTALAITYRLAITLQPTATGTNLRCKVSVANGGAVQAQGHVPFQTGTLAFTTDLHTTIEGILVLERDDAPAL
jgi:hypothetical protein